MKVALFSLGSAGDTANEEIMAQIEQSGHVVQDFTKESVGLDSIDSYWNLRSVIKKGLPSFDVGLFLRCRQGIGDFPISRLPTYLLSAGFPLITIGQLNISEGIYVTPDSPIIFWETAMIDVSSGESINIAPTHPVGKGWETLPANLFSRREVIKTAPPAVNLAFDEKTKAIAAFAAEIKLSTKGIPRSVKWVHYSGNLSAPPAQFIDNAIKWAGSNMSPLLAIGAVGLIGGLMLSKSSRR